MKFPLVAGAFVLSTVGISQADPSFDCSRASYPDEFTICAYADLSRLDQELAYAYKSARASLSRSERECMQQAQRRWLEARHRCETDEVCLKTAFSTRIDELWRSQSEGGARCADGPTPAQSISSYSPVSWQILGRQQSAEGAQCSVISSQGLGIRFFDNGDPLIAFMDLTYESTPALFFFEAEGAAPGEIRAGEYQYATTLVLADTRSAEGGRIEHIIIFKDSGGHVTDYMLRNDRLLVRFGIGDGEFMGRDNADLVYSLQGVAQAIGDALSCLYDG